MAKVTVTATKLSKSTMMGRIGRLTLDLLRNVDLSEAKRHAIGYKQRPMLNMHVQPNSPKQNCRLSGPRDTNIQQGPIDGFRILAIPPCHFHRRSSCPVLSSLA